MAKWIGYITDKNYDSENKKQPFGMPAAYFRREFYTEKPIKKAKIRLSALGVFSAFINGIAVNDDFLSPGWTEYAKTVEYYEYDVTDIIQNGKNALSVTVADGWYASNVSNVGKCVFGGYPLKLWYRIEISFSDGTKEIIKADGTEKASCGAIRYCDNQNGIKIDNRRDLADISPTDSAAEMFPVEVFVLPAPKRALCAPIKEQFRFGGVCVKRDSESVILDFKQNFAGVLDCVFKGKRGDTITILHGEALTKKGDLYTENLRTALATDTFVLGSENEERFFPKLVFHGFRYAKIIMPSGVKLISAEGVAIFSDMQRSGKFSCGNELVNSIYSNVLWGQRGNFISVPTDCPQRDERLGWTGDAQIFCKTAMFNYNTERFFNKYIRDMRDSIDLYGYGVPVTVPYVFDSLKKKGEYYTGWMGWSDAVVIIPYTHYLMYGDVSVLKETLSYMKNYLNYVKDNISDMHSFGDWLSINEETDKQVFDTMYFAFTAGLLSKICGILRDNDKHRYRALFLNIKRAFRKKYIDENGVIKSDTQSCYVLAYSFGLIGKGLARRALKRKLKQFNYHLTTGFHGTKYLLPALCSLGLTRHAFDILLNEDAPSWGYMVRSGATTVWERWNSYDEETGFNHNGMNSLNHYSLGSCGEWFYTHMLGINPVEDAPGWKTVKISPYFDKRISHAKGSYKTSQGVIKVEYTMRSGSVRYALTVPVNTSVKFDFNGEVFSATENVKKHVKKYEIHLKL